ncbi:MAG TPA: hypothetical protein VEI07_15740, partial [Planctomycetaceae bacterium]|nr:hypothetical protein [Planctomycetaceae bacterium]
HVYRHVLVPPNDGGICLGQLAIGAAALAAPVKLEQVSELHAPRRASSVSPPSKRGIPGPGPQPPDDRTALLIAKEEG